MINYLTSVHNHITTENLTKALYTFQLHQFDGITFNFDYATSGVGCTALSVFPAYQVMPQRYDFRMTVRPLCRTLMVTILLQLHLCIKITCR